MLVQLDIHLVLFGRSKVMMGDTESREEANDQRLFDVKRHTQIAKDRGSRSLSLTGRERKDILQIFQRHLTYGTLYNSTLRAVDEGIAAKASFALEAHYRNVLAKHNKQY